MKTSIGCKGDFENGVCALCQKSEKDHWQIPEGARLISTRIEALDYVRTILAQHNARVTKLNRRHGQTIEAARLEELRTYKAKVTTQGGIEVEHFYADLLVWAPKAVIEGWEIVAVLVNTEAGFLASKVSGVGIKDVTPYAKHGGQCDHCRTARRRNTTYVVREVCARRAIKVVGSNCVKDFTGHRDPRSLLAYADYLAGLEEELDREEDSSRVLGYSGSAYAVSLGHFLGFVRMSMRVHSGFISRTQAFNGAGRRATADDALEFMRMVDDARFQIAKAKAEDEKAGCEPRYLDWAEATLKSPYVPTEEDMHHAVKDLDLVEATLSDKETLDDFESNVFAVVNQGFVFGRNAGVAAYICKFADKLRNEVSRKAAQATRKDEWFGEEKKREVWTLKVVFVTETESEWGRSYLHIAADPEGRTAKWFGKNEVEKGTYKIKGTVKRHDVAKMGRYQGQKETVLTRVVVVEKLEVASPAA